MPTQLYGDVTATSRFDDVQRIFKNNDNKFDINTRRILYFDELPKLSSKYDDDDEMISFFSAEKLESWRYQKA